METAIAKKIWHKKKKLGKATEYQRAALVIAALGGDPQAVSDMAGEDHQSDRRRNVQPRKRQNRSIRREQMH